MRKRFKAQILAVEVGLQKLCKSCHWLVPRSSSTPLGILGRTSATASPAARRPLQRSPDPAPGEGRPRWGSWRWLRIRRGPVLGRSVFPPRGHNLVAAKLLLRPGPSTTKASSSKDWFRPTGNSGSTMHARVDAKLPNWAGWSVSAISSHHAMLPFRGCGRLPTLSQLHHGLLACPNLSMGRPTMNPKTLEVQRGVTRWRSFP